MAGCALGNVGSFGVDFWVGFDGIGRVILGGIWVGSGGGNY